MKKIIFAILLITTLLLASCGSNGSGSSGSNNVAQEYQCAIDSDCVAASCCHATESVNQDHAPDCSATLCTADCQEGTMDCGYAKAMCVSGACTVVSNS